MIDIFLASKFMTLEVEGDRPELIPYLESFRERIRDRCLNEDTDPSIMPPEVQQFAHQLRASLQCSQSS